MGGGKSMARPDSWRAKPKGGGFVVETIYDLIDEAVCKYWAARVRNAIAARDARENSNVGTDDRAEEQARLDA